MDQIRAALSWLKEHHFWVLAVMVLGMAVGGWFMGASSLSAGYKSQKSKIDSEFKQQQSLRGKPFKPNDAINERQQEEVKKLSAEVNQVWSALYDRQREKVLKWPTELGSDFVKSMEGKKFGDPILDRRRQRYLDYIQKRFPKLLEIVDAEDLGEGTGGGRGGRRGGAPGGFGGPGGYGGPGLGGRRGGLEGGQQEEQKSHMVDWLDQGNLRTRLDLTKRPEPLEIWVLQEDLWVYESLLGAIAETNRATGATQQSRAAVRVIEQLTVGAPAAGANQSTGRLAVPDVSSSASSSGLGGGFGGYPGGPGGFPGGEGGFPGGFGGEGGFSGGFGGEGGYGGRGGPGGGYGGGFGAAGAEGLGDGQLADLLLAGRYLDETDQPITSVPSDLSFGREYKRLPVMMSLEMDHRWVTTLLLELANAPLQVEIEQVRVNPAGQTGNSRRSNSRGGQDSGESFDRTPNIGTVILQGAVYIFNEPDPAVLKVEDEAI